MTLIKSLLLGSAAGIVAIASAQAADLPTKKGAVAVQYVKVCTITANGTPITGFVLPGSDTCIKFTGYISAQIEGGNLEQAYSYNYGLSAKDPVTGNYKAVAPAQSGPTGRFGIDAFGYSTRTNFEVDTVSNTAYGPLLGHFEFQFNHSEGFDNLGSGGSDGGLNRAYVTWAGITAGKANSFYAFTGGGPGYANFLSPDRWGFEQPDLIAYTASFGGGFAATLSVESPAYSQLGGLGYTTNLGNYTNGGMRSPDIVGNLKLTQGWGSVGVSGQAHEVRAIANLDGSTLDKWGFGVDAGISFNLPSFGPGDDLVITGAYSENAIQASGMQPGEGMWGEGGNTNLNGQQLALGDTFYDGKGIWAKPTAWTISATADHHFNAQWTFSPEFSYGEINWNNDPAGLLTNGRTYIAGGVAHYDPVVNLDFELELLYQNSHSDRPAALPVATAWHADADGFAARFQITRSW